jgi:hypothetical protein
VEKDKAVLTIAIGASIASIPTLYRKPSAKFWVAQLLINGMSNIAIDTFLTKKKYIKYPVRFAPKAFKVQLIYDCLICPYISVWLCQTTMRASLKKIVGMTLLFAIPQLLLEHLALKTTNLIKYGNNWTLSRTFFAILFAKILARVYSALSFKLIQQNDTINKKMPLEEYH